MFYSIDNVIERLGVFSLLKTDGNEYRHRRVYVPGDDISDLPEDIQLQVNTIWTPEAVTNYEAYKAEQKSETW